MFAKQTDQAVPDQKQIKMLMTILDSNQDGKISYEEIKCVLGDIIKILDKTFGKEYQIHLYEKMLSDEMKFNDVLKGIFDQYDSNKNG